MDELLIGLKALGDQKRLMIISLLNNRDICVSALAQVLGISQAAVSQHLQILRQAGLIRGEKKGYWTHYTLIEDQFKKISDDILKLLTEEKVDFGACLAPGKHCLKKEGIENA